MNQNGLSLTRFIFHSRWFQVLWLFLFALTLFFYFRLNPPLRVIAHNLAPLPVALLHLLALTGLGWPCARVFLKSQTRTIEFLLSLSIGIGLTAILTLVLGVFGTFDSLLFLIWESLGAVLFVLAVLKWKPWTGIQTVWTPWEALGAAILGLFLVALIPFIVAPEISTDAIAYHLLIPKMYLQQGGIHHLPLFVEAYYPNLAELNYLPLLVLSNEFVCKAFHFWCGIALLIFLAHFVKRVQPSSGRLLAPALFLSMPVTAIHIGWAWNDFIYSLFVLLSLYFLYSYHQSDKSSGRDLLIAGILAGLSSWTKYTFVLYFFTTILLFLLGYKRWKWRLRHFYLFYLGIGLIAPFWLAQNYAFTGNPFYPFLNRIFHSPHWTENSDRYFHDALRRWEIAEWSWKTYLTFPFHITMKARLVDIQTGILPLTLLPLLFLRSPSAGVRFLKAYIVCCVFVWLFIHTENRSLFTVFAALFCVSGIAIEEFPWKTKRIRNCMIAGLAIVSCTNFFYTTLTSYHLFDPFRYFIGRETAEQYRTRLSESQRAFDYVNQLRKSGRILLVSIHVPYYLHRPNLFSSFADPPVAQVLSQGSKTAEEIEASMRRLGVTHILLNRSDYQKENQNRLYSWSEQERKLFEEFLLKRCKPLIRFGSDYVFQVM